MLYTCGMSTHHWRAFRKVFWLGLSLSRVTMWNRVNYGMGLIEKGIYRSLGPYKFCFIFSLVKTHGDYVEHIWSRILIPRRFLCLCMCVFFKNLSFILKLHIVISTTAFIAGRTWEHLKHHILSSAYFSKVTSKKGKSATLSQFQWWVLSIDPFFLPLSQEELRIGKIR